MVENLPIKVIVEVNSTIVGRILTKMSIETKSRLKTPCLGFSPSCRKCLDCCPPSLKFWHVFHTLCVTHIKLEESVLVQELKNASCSKSNNNLHRCDCHVNKVEGTGMHCAANAADTSSVRQYPMFTCRWTWFIVNML